MCVTPQPFQIVVAALFFDEQMHDHIAIIHQHPTAVGRTLDGKRQLGELFFDQLAHVICQRAELPVTIAVANDKKVRDDGIGTQIQQSNIFCFFVFDYIYNVARKFECIQRSLREE